MKNKGLVATIIIMSGIIVMLLVTLLLIKLPSIEGIKSIINDKSSEHTEETIDKIEIINETETTVPEKKVKTEIMHYNGYNGNVDIEYPEISGMDDIELQKRLNYKIKTNALSIVPLYPISTALQKLDIYCEVKSMDDRYITILYTGKVIGKNVKESTATIKNEVSSNGTSRTTGVRGNDPYLNGFVDPLANIAAMQNAGIQNQTSNSLPANNNTATSVTNGTTFNSLPLPQTNMTTEVFKEQTAITKANDDTNKKSNNSNTADAGPTVWNEPAPTAKNASKKLETNVVDGNYATNNPTSSAINMNNNSSSGIVYSGNATNTPLVPTANVPDSEYGPGNPNQVNTGVPVYAYAGSNTSASTIDQNIFYTNTIDLVHCVDVPLASYADVETLAKYARSSKAELVNINADKVSEVRTYIRRTVQSKLVETLKEADFRNAELKIWPKHFSYTDNEGNIYFTIKLSSKLGNYVIIKYSK